MTRVRELAGAVFYYVVMKPVAFVVEFMRGPKR